MGRLRHEAGQTVVLFAILLPLFLGLGAIAVDVGSWYVVKKTAQDAADAAALAAARELPNRDSAMTVARAYVDRNMPGATADVRTPYEAGGGLPGVVEGGDPNQVEVTVTQSAGTFFGRIFGVLDVTVSQRAVAEQRPAVNDVAIHAHDTNCVNDALLLEGNSMRVGGVIQSNGSLELDGDDFRSGPASAGGPNNCSIQVNGRNPSFAGRLAPARHPSTLGWPAYFIPAEFICDYNKQNFDFPEDGRTLEPGVYCAEESFVATGDSQTGRITVLSPRIEISGDGQRFSPAEKGKGLLFFNVANSTLPREDDFEPPHCEYRDGLLLNATDYVLTGIMFNPCDKITITGHGELEGLIEGFTVEISAEDFRMKAGGELPNQVRLSLAE